MGLGNHTMYELKYREAYIWPNRRFILIGHAIKIPVNLLRMIFGWCNVLFGCLSRELVLIDVEDVNDNRPEWTRSAFSAEANEGRIYDRLLRLEAADADGSDAFSKICRYHVVTKDVPFEADSNGSSRIIYHIDV